MNKKEIQELIDYIKKTEMDEVYIQTKDITLKVKRTPSIYSSPSPELTQTVPLAPTLIDNDIRTNSEESKVDQKSEDNLVEIKSPMIGTFYKYPNPDAPPFVKEGDKISRGKAICIIEAMKLFNEIESEISGTVRKILVEDGTPVEYDQPLFLIEPS